mmetsp:Transcript_19378/g.21554  ORF Transcript_19378/g.21554 Transcript_19378/m.21554 type:complete len:160 (+) Transcript_19378:100-579(+)
MKRILIPWERDEGKDIEEAEAAEILSRTYFRMSELMDVVDEEVSAKRDIHLTEEHMNALSALLDGTSSIDYEKFLELLASLHVSEEQLQELVAIDEETGEGGIDLDQFSLFLDSHLSELMLCLSALVYSEINIMRTIKQAPVEEDIDTGGNKDDFSTID